MSYALEVANSRPELRRMPKEPAPLPPPQEVVMHRQLVNLYLRAAGLPEVGSDGNSQVNPG